MVDEGPTGVKAPDGGWGWAVLFGCFVITGFSYAFPKAVSVFFKELMREFGIGYSDTAWISSILLAMLYGTGEGGLTPGPRPGLCWQILPGAGARVWPGSATGPSARSPGTLEGSPWGGDPAGQQHVLHGANPGRVRSPSWPLSKRVGCIFRQSQRTGLPRAVPEKMAVPALQGPRSPAGGARLSLCPALGLARSVPRCPAEGGVAWEGEAGCRR